MSEDGVDVRDREFDLIWKALSDATRRKLLDLLNERPRTTGELAAQFQLSRFAIMKHLSVLESADLIEWERKGRERWNRIHREPLARIYQRWLSRQTAWEPTLEPAAPARTRTTMVNDASVEIEPLRELHFIVRPEEKYAVERALQSVVPPIYVCMDAVGRGDARGGGPFLPKVAFVLSVPDSYVAPLIKAIGSALKMEGGPAEHGAGLAVIAPLEEEIVIGSPREHATPAERVLAEGWSGEVGP